MADGSPKAEEGDRRQGMIGPWERDGQTRNKAERGNTQRLISLKRARIVPSPRRGCLMHWEEHGQHGTDELGTPWRPQCSSPSVSSGQRASPFRAGEQSSTAIKRTLGGLLPCVIRLRRDIET